MSGTIVVDRIESDASYASSINIASPLVVANTVSFSQPVTVSNTFVVPAGTVSAPAITPTGDTNTGIYFPAADNIGFATGGTIRGRWTTDGLCFGSDTAAANALDDYEEGTWTPVVTSGTGTITAYTATGKYTKIGNVVTIMFDAFITTAGTASGKLFFSGLPFTVGYADILVQPATSSRESFTTGNVYTAYVLGGDTTGAIQNFTNSGVAWGNDYRYTFVVSYQT